MHASALPVSRASCPWAGRSPTRPCAPRCAHLLLFPWLRVPLRWRCSCPRALRAGSGSLGDCRGGLRAAAARVGHQKECCRVVGFVRRGEETGRHGWRLRAGRECPNRPPARGGSAAPVLGVLAHAWLRGAVRSVQPSAACARISVQGADGGGKLWLCCTGDMWLHVMHGDQIWGLHTLRALCAASHGREDACSTLGLSEGLSCAPRAHGCRICPWQRCAPAVCTAVLCAMRGCLCNARLRASSDSEQRCHWLHISAGDLGQCWKNLSSAAIPEGSAACVAVGVCPSSQRGHRQQLFRLCLLLSAARAVRM